MEELRPHLGISTWHVYTCSVGENLVHGRTWLQVQQRIQPAMVLL